MTIQEDSLCPVDSLFSARFAVYFPEDKIASLQKIDMKQVGKN